MNRYIIISIIIFFVSCKKEENKSRAFEHTQVAPALYPYLFKVGSYWIYRNSFTGNQDSIGVRTVNRFTYNLGPSGPGEGSPGDEEYVKVTYYGSIYYEETFRTTTIYRGPFEEGSTPKSVSFFSGSPGSIWVNATYEAVLDSLTVEGTTYHDVVKMRIQQDAYISNCNFYYVKNIGIIRKELLTNNIVTSTHDLIRYNTTLYPYP
ncbi:MAG: hypothetical protein K0Q95_3027 [Bacteroidota bacterium]|jgi:hypothetical protein|nr:hypothetical protein [Bacteroidota bacterium]